MCFEWDKRYFRELEEKKSKKKVDEVIRNAEDAVNHSQASEAVKTDVNQPRGRDVDALT